MGRRPQGWTLTHDQRRGTYGVRFTLAGRRRHISTGERDPVRAANAAARLYAEAISGRRQPGPALPLDEIAASWLATVEPQVHVSTWDQYRLQLVAHILPFFGDTSTLTTAGLEDYAAHRLRQVSRSTAARELAVLGRLVRHAHARGWLEELPAVPRLPPRATGRRVYDRRAQLLEPETVEELLAALPEYSERAHDGRRFAVRARWIVAWETALRPATLDRLRAPEDYVRGQDHLVIRPEADKARFGRRLPLTARARAALDSVVPDVGEIFGRHDHRDHLERAASAVGLDHVTPYDLRHSRLTFWARHSTDLAALGYLAGHRHATTTSRYVHQAERGAAAILAAGVQNSGRIPDAATDHEPEGNEPKCLVRKEGLEPSRGLAHRILNRQRRK